MRGALFLIAIALAVSACGGAAAPYVPSVRAGPQRATLDWVESYPPRRPALVFRVRWFEVTRAGWSAAVSVENRSKVGWAVGRGRLASERAFGVLLFPNADLREVERRNREGTLPAIRPASSYRPPLPQVLAPGGSWSGTISAPGPLAAELWVRISLGVFASVGTPPPGVEPQVVWFTDHALRLKR